MPLSVKPYLLLFSLLSLLFIPSLSLSQEAGQTLPIDTDFLLPKELALCGEPMPLGNPWVWEMLDREMTISVWDKEQVFMWLKRAGRYFPYFEEILIKEGMPLDIKYLAIAESGLLPKIRSNKGAMGLWQFMQDTAVRNGLRSDRHMDERRDVKQATAAALKYLRDLREICGSWTLAMAAYNCGEQRIKKAVKEQRQSDYYNLKLPDETERYIYRIAAVKLIMENPNAYGYRVPEEKIYKPTVCDTVTVTVKNNIHIADFAEVIGTSLKMIRDLNPKIIDNTLPNGTYTLNVPPGTGVSVPGTLKALSGKAPSHQTGASSSSIYVVKGGETLSSISQKTGISVSRLKTLNNIQGSVIKVGQKLRLE
jgi:membrane-bound lytic murein transglycosylase D